LLIILWRKVTQNTYEGLSGPVFGRVALAELKVGMAHKGASMKPQLPNPMKNLKLSLLLAGLAALTFSTVRASDLSDASGFKDACTAGSLLSASHISNQVVVAAGEAGCIYQVNGVSYLYTTKGSAKINPAQLGRVSLQNVSRDEVQRVGGGRDEIRNGCLVFATCAYAGYKHDPHVAWAGIIAAQILTVNGGMARTGAECFGGLSGHAITAFENDKREIFVQENGEEPRKVDNMTELAQSGNRSWHDSSTLIYCDHRIQGFTSFKAEFGHPL
jgi:hypothetical protein